MQFYGSNRDVAQFAVALVINFESGLLSITIITQGSLEGCFVSIVIDTSLEETAKKLARTYSLQPINT